jgi:DNA-binding beta-propeller fold protein YncE
MLVPMRRLVYAGVLVGLAAVAAGPGYRVIRTFPVGGEGGWDYLTVDSGARRLYVSHANKVVVLQADEGKVIGEIADTPGVHGIALAPELNRGFISAGRADEATIFDLKTLAPVSKVKTGQNPDAILYDGVSGRVFTFNGRSKDATVFDAKTGAVVATMPLGGKPEFAVADGKGRAYVNIEDTSEVVEIDTRKPAALKRYSLKPCEEPSGLAMDRKQRRLFSVCGNGMMAVSDPDGGRVVATPAIGHGPDGAGFDSGLGLAFSSNGEGTLTIVGQTGGQWAPVETVRTERGARTMTIDEKTHRVYLPTSDFGPAPEPTPQNPRPRPALVPNSFRILVVGK